jgi:hypothetical protein
LKRLTNLTYNIIASYIIICLLSCAIDIDNPLWENYEGQYDLAVDFNSLPDTLYPFRNYNLNWIDKGKDKYFKINIKSNPVRKVDTTLLPVSSKQNSLSLRLLDVFEGNLIVVGIRPNENRDEYTNSIIVKNPYTIIIDSTTLTGSVPVKFSIKDKLPVQSDSVLNVVWFVNSEKKDSLSYLTQFTYAPKNVTLLNVKAMVIDYSGSGLLLDSITVRLPQRPLPNVQITEKTLNPPVGKPYTISAIVTNADSLYWKSSRKRFDTTIAGSQITATWSDTITDTVIVLAKDLYNTSGMSDTVIIKPRPYNYDLNIVSFPTEILTARQITWQVQATKDNSPVPDSNVTYKWTMSPAKPYDSIVNNGKSISLRFNNEKTFVLSVIAYIGTDSTVHISRTVVVKNNAPVLTVTPLELTTPINIPISVVAKATDRNADGSIKAVYYKVESSATAKIITGDTLKEIFTTPGDKIIHVWTVDNENLTSDTLKVVVHVTANRPYFQRAVIDTTINIRERALITIKALAGNTGDSIISYVWDYNNDGVWDKTTAAGSFDSVYQSVQNDTIRVGCRNQRGDSADTPAIIVIRVLPGIPQVLTVTAAPLQLYIGGLAQIRVSGTDPNGTITKIAVRANDGTDSIYTIVAAKTLDTMLNYQLRTTGKYGFSAAVIDNDNYKSDYKKAADTITVNKGEPVVTKFKPDTVWINDTTTYTISATDVNGTVKTWNIKWSSAGNFTNYTDSVVKYAFTTAGKQYVKLVVTDNDNLTSDTLTDSVFVRLGRPLAALTLPDTVYCFKNVPVTLRSIDSNGTIKQYAVSWNTGETFEQKSNDSTFTHAYLTEGRKYLRAYAVDDDGFTSDTIGKYVYVKLGAPRITSISLNKPLNAIYIRDPITFTVKGRDENDYIDSILISWNGDTLFEVKVKVEDRKDSLSVVHTFARSDSGVKQIRFRVKDPDGLVKDSVYSVTVKAGAPTVNDLRPIQTWINDDSTYTVTASDINGTILKYYYDWNNDGVWDDSSVTNSKTKAFSTSGTTTVKVGVMDDDSLIVSSQFTINVRLGMPRVWNPQGDTMFVVCPTGGGDVTLKVNSFDTNGTVVKYYWDFNSANGLDTNVTAQYKTDVDSLTFTIPPSGVNIPFKMAALAKDDDGLVAIDTFFLLPDESPPTTTTTSDAQAGVRKISWKNKDAIDGVATEYKIVIKKEGSNSFDSVTVADESNPAYIVQDFKAGSLYESGTTGYEFGYTYTPTAGNGTYHYRIIARDKRGSLSRTLGDPNFGF